jgi:hypothetical protein
MKMGASSDIFWAATGERRSIYSGAVEPVYEYGLDALVAVRRGVKKATIATAHTLLVIAFHILKAPVEYRDLGGDHFDRLHPETLKHKLVKRDLKRSALRSLLNL